VRVLIGAECFLPEVNGVTNSVRRVVEHLGRRGHDALIIAPGPGPDEHEGVEVVRVPSFSLPRYGSLHVGLTGRTRLQPVFERFRPDVVHLAAPCVLGYGVARAARLAGVPSVAVFQTDLAGFAHRNRLGALDPAVWRWLRKVHALADRTLVPSTATAWQLRRHGIGPLGIWRRGVDLDQFDPARRDPGFRAEVGAGAGDLVVGYVGRLAPEKRVHLLEGLQSVPGVRLVVIGDGPSRRDLEHRMPRARFTGFLGGSDLGRAMATLDVFVHTGADETFCQAVQEAMAAGVPVVAPAAGGPVDLVRHGIEGFLYPPDDAATMREAVVSLQLDPMLRRLMAERARAAVAGATWEAVCDQLLDHYALVLPGGPHELVRGLGPRRLAGDVHGVALVGP
jgi:phosphatidylinositol alpha 1,6-mannosyltransferase